MVIFSVIIILEFLIYDFVVDCKVYKLMNFKVIRNSYMEVEFIGFVVRERRYVIGLIVLIGVLVIKCELNSYFFCV